MNHISNQSNGGNGHQLDAQPDATWQGDEDGIDLRQAAAVFARRWWLVVAALAACTAAAALYTSVSPWVYEGKVTVLVDTKGSSQATGDNPIIEGLAALSQSRSIQTQAEIMKSYPIVDGALATLAASQAEQVQNKRIQVKALRDTDIIEITVPATSPEVAVAMANAMARCYIEQMQQTNRADLSAMLAYVTEQLAVLKPEIAQMGMNLRRFKESNGTVDLPSEVTALVGQHATMEADRRAAEIELASARVALSARESEPLAIAGRWSARSTVAQSGNVSGRQLARSDTVSAIKTRLTELELARTAATSEYAPRSPEVRSFDAQIQDAKSQLASEATIATAQDIAPLQARVWIAEASLQALRSADDRALLRLRRLPALEYRLAQLTSDLQSRQKTYEILDEKRQQLRITEQARVALARIVAPAKPPEAPVRPRRSVNLLLGVMLGLLLGLGLVMLAERLDDRVHSEEESATACGAPLLGVIRRMRGTEAVLLAASDERSDLLESFRALRTSITLSAADTPVRVLVITSSRPSEGKTTIAYDLARVLALDGRRTIIVDADLRRPSLHNCLQCPNDAGLTNVAVGQKSVADVLRETETPGLQAILAGPVPPNPPELLNSGAWRRALDDLRGMAEYVIIDTPPLTMFTDAQVLASMSDATIMVVSSSETNAGQLRESHRLLDTVGARLLGFVMNKVERRFGSGYYYSYAYHYGEDSESGTRRKSRRRKGSTSP